MSSADVAARLVAGLDAFARPDLLKIHYAVARKLREIEKTVRNSSECERKRLKP